MGSFWETPFIVVDVETSGPSYQKNKIIDIACVTAIGGEIVSSYQSLVNPHQYIPYYISNMTGISNELVFQAPEPEDVMPEISRILATQEAVFVAHNVMFDWHFVHQTLIDNGYEVPQIGKLCTVKLAKRLLPSLKKRNLGFLSEYFEIKIKNRHRAYGDAIATAHILNIMLEMAEQEHGITSIDELLRFQNLPSKNFAPKAKYLQRVEPFLEQLPHEPGVYYFAGSKGEILYVGKAKCLSERVKSYFRGDASATRDLTKLIRRIHKITWECTGSELSALLLESREIKRLQPPFNSLEKQYRNYPFIKFVNDDGFPYPVIARFVDGLNGEFYGPFRSMHFTEEIMDIIDKQFKLRKCTADIRPDESRMPCLYHQIERCGSPCSLRNTTDEYEEELNKVRSFLSSFSNGIVSKLEAQMLEFADNLDFENAIKTKYRLNEVRRLFERQKNVPTSINQNNVIIIIPTSGREKTVEIFLIRYGRLVHQQEYGRKAPLDKLFELLEQTYYSSNEPEEPNTPQAVDELRIITAWQYRMQSNGTFAYVINKTLDELKKEVESGIRNAFSNNEEEIIENIDLQDYSSI